MNFPELGIVAMTGHRYYRLHLPTGNVSTGTFNEVQSPEFATIGWRPSRTSELLEQAKLRVINDWNRQQPHTWKYWI